MNRSIPELGRRGELCERGGSPPGNMTIANEAISRLREGNRRFISHVTQGVPLELSTSEVELAQKQEPMAIIVGCSDARVPAEMVFDQRLGNLFVVRVAGNVVAPSQVGSVEFAAEQFGTRLVVVLGHSGCGAVTRPWVAKCRMR